MSEAPPGGCPCGSGRDGVRCACACLRARQVFSQSSTTHWGLFIPPRYAFQLRHSNALHSQQRPNDASRSISWVNDERRRADRVQQSSRIARRQTLAEMRRSVARRLAPFDSPIGFHHRNLTRSACLGKSWTCAGLGLLTP